MKTFCINLIKCKFETQYAFLFARYLVYKVLLLYVFWLEIVCYGNIMLWILESHFLTVFFLSQPGIHTYEYHVVDPLLSVSIGSEEEALIGFKDLFHTGMHTSLANSCWNDHSLHGRRSVILYVKHVCDRYLRILFYLNFEAYNWFCYFIFSNKKMCLCVDISSKCMNNIEKVDFRKVRGT